MLILGKCLPPQTAFGLAFQLGHFQLKNEGEKRRDLSSSSLSPFHLEMHLLKKAKRQTPMLPNSSCHIDDFSEETGPDD